VRSSLRDFFEVDWRFIVLATLRELQRDGKVTAEQVQQAMKDLEIGAEKRSPVTT
jgi:pyruvate dehydrogenase E1 component